MRGKLQIRYSADGKIYEETLDLPNTKAGVAEAVRIRKQRKIAREHGLIEQTVLRPFEEVAQAYLDSADLKLSTRNSYRDALNIYWLPHLKGRDVGGITSRDLVDIDDGICWTSKKTRLNALIPLRQVFEHCVNRTIRLDNPANALRSRKHRKARAPDPYTKEERDMLLNWLRDNGTSPAYEYFHTAFHTGMRTGELIALEWRDFDGESLMVERGYVRRTTTTTKTDRWRRVILLPNAIAVLESMCRGEPGQQIFLNQYGRRFQSGYHLNRSLRKAHVATGIRQRTGPYPWRHTYASVALTAGVRPALVAAQLGHSLQVLLSTYAKWIPDDEDRTELSKMED